MLPLCALVLLEFAVLDIKVSSAASPAGSLSAIMNDCKDFQGKRISHDSIFIPEADCQICVCDNGQKSRCKTVLCHPPAQCKSFELGPTCCDFICTDNGSNRPHSSSGGSGDFNIWLVASGIVATFSLTMLFFVINRLRHRKEQGREHLHHMHHHHRPPISDDQRSIGSIGYIAGNMSYNGEMFDGAANPYPLWKPPNGCFPRGEAPPPYEEVIGLTDHQALGAVAGSCTTVSLGHHRTLPLSICSEATVPGDFQGFVPQSSVANAAATTNLINININNAGTITSVAAGETHQVPGPTATSSSNATTNPGMNGGGNPYK